ncbi:hypothetical protein Aab01nite_73620 [Paractinoplanes abujensis]|uniref:Uncharacterized protein n=1 Tax=Paractinoplanes abujensis TaxID=882441 RepID=A0A7W7CUR0_9ACTN|nr:hypothetical protein [Actinoplanes abujensis]MBB4695040.1 hypothetical protein [Actinoplanes abujensis]GID23772.1 hypothetical protein Aab01nite_73620 [Actinoplanes abujensis]
MVAAFNLGVWRQALLPHGALYRWEGDQGRSGSGFVVVDSRAGTVRPAGRAGEPVGELAADLRTAAVSGASDGVDRSAFLQVVAAILRARARSGEWPETAHAHYG